LLSFGELIEQFNTKQMTIQHPRILKTETPLRDAAQVIVAAPRSAHGQNAAKGIHQTLKEMGVRSEIADDPEIESLMTAGGPTIIVGNLSDSCCVRALYFRTLCATDLWYPGPTGYELRTLCNPFGSGHNVILVGYSDEEGVKEGCKVFLSKLDDSIPHLKDLKITRIPLSPDEAEDCRTTPLPETSWQIANVMLGDWKGYLYYLTGEPKLGEEYRKTWKAVIECGYDKNEKMVQTHLYSLMRFLPWRLVEDMDLFNAEERLAITQFLYGWVESEEGWRHVADCPRTQRPDNPRQNHELVPALTLMYIAEYFEMYFPEISGPEKWRAVGRQAFEPYGSSWKPLCDGLCHGWWMSQPVMLEYALLDPEHRYFEEGGARLAAECAMAVVNNDGWLPTAGDCDLRRQFPGASLRVAAAYYGDGRLRFVHDLAPPNRQLAILTTLPRAFDNGLEPLEPKEMIGVTVIPVDPLIYHIWERDPEIAELTVSSPPAAPIDQCFDKLAIRTGWTLPDDYLLIDGLGGGSHSYDDAGGIIEYARLGVSLIVQEDGLVQSAPEHHSIVTIVRDGETGIIPGFTILEANETDASGTVYLRIRSKDHAGADWVREIHLFPGKCAVFVDTVTANTEGDFAVEAHFRTPTQLTLEDRGARGKRKSPCVDEVNVRLESLCDPSHLRTTEEPIHLRYPEPKDQARWKDRYRTDEMLLTAFSARETAHLQPGESLRLVHLVQGCATGEAIFHPLEKETDIFISDGKTQEQLISFEIKRPKEKTPETNDPVRKLGASSFYDAGEPITALCPLNDGSMAVGTETGTLSLVNSDGSKMWATELEGPVRDIGAAQGNSLMLAAGHGRISLSGFSGSGENLWTSKIEHEPCPWPWWELPTPAAVQVAGGIWKNEPFFAVGCGDLQLRCFDAKGRESWKWRYNEGVPGRVRVADMDGSGEPRIIVGGEILSDQSTCRILDPDRNLLADLPVEGWTSMLTALAFGEKQGRHFIGCGASRGANFHLFELENDGWKRRWLKRPGGQVTGIHIFGAEDRIVAVTSQGFLLCYDLNGEPVWHRLFDQGIQHLAPMKDGLLTIDNAGGLLKVDLSGNIEELSPLPSTCSFTAVNDTVVYLASGSELQRLKNP
jgi:hypothetical protein